MNVTVIGAGLAGSECAWQLAQRGIQVELHEMKPEKMTPAHTTEYFAELCCSNSLRGAGLENAVGLLKEELRRLDSLILQCADATRVDFPREMAIGALALYISNESVTQFQPMNINFGIIPPLDHFVKGKRNKNAEISQRALAILEETKADILA